MAKDTRNVVPLHAYRPVSLCELIHACVRGAIESAVKEELEAALEAKPYERDSRRRGYRNGAKARGLTGPTGPVTLQLPRGRLFTEGGDVEWRSRLVPRYQRRMREINEAVIETYLAGVNTRRLRGALRPLLKAAPLSRSAVSRVVATLKGDLEAWNKRSLEALDVAYLCLDAIALRVRSAGKVTSCPVLAAMVVLADGSKQLLGLEMCASESFEAWKGFLDDFVTRKLRAPLLCIIDGNSGLHRAVELVWPKARIQRCTVHKLRNIERKAPKHAIDEIREDYHRIVYAEKEADARLAYAAFERKWSQSCPSVVRSLKEGSDELLTFFDFPKAQWKALRTTNSLERLNEEFRRRVKTQASFPTEDAAIVLLWSLVISGQIRIRKIAGFRTIPNLLRRSLRAAA